MFTEQEVFAKIGFQALLVDKLQEQVNLLNGLLTQKQEGADDPETPEEDVSDSSNNSSTPDIE